MSGTDESDSSQKLFGLKVVQQFDSGTQKISTRIETFGQGMSIHEAVTHIELWLETTKKRLRENFERHFQAGF